MAYRAFVEPGIAQPPPWPFQEAFGGWVLGSRRFLERLRTLAGPAVGNPPLPESRLLAGLDPDEIFRAVTAFYRIDPALLTRRGDPHLARAVAAWLCRRHTELTLRELAARLGLSRAHSCRTSPGASRTGGWPSVSRPARWAQSSEPLATIRHDQEANLFSGFLGFVFF